MPERAPAAPPRPRVDRIGGDAVQGSGSDFGSSDLREGFATERGRELRFDGIEKPAPNWPPRGKRATCLALTLGLNQPLYVNSSGKLEAPPGFEPGMEVLQTGPETLSC